MAGSIGMPTYEYECEACGRSFEWSQKMMDAPLKKCTFDGCGGHVHRLVSAGAGLIFKGSGFYETDYKRKSGSEASSCPAAKSGACPNSGLCPAASKGD